MLRTKYYAYSAARKWCGIADSPLDAAMKLITANSDVQEWSPAIIVTQHGFDPICIEEEDMTLDTEVVLGCFDEGIM